MLHARTTLGWLTTVAILTLVSPAVAEPDSSPMLDRRLFEDLGADYHLMNASLHMRGRQYDQAMSDVSKSIELHPEKPMLYLVRAAFHAISKQFEKALIDIDKAISLDPNLIQAHKGDGVVSGPFFFVY